MTNLSWYTALLLLPVLCRPSSARRGHWLGTHKHNRGWGLQSKPAVALTPNTETLGSFLLQVRGGSSYDDSYNRDRRKPNQGGGYYDDDNYSQGFDPKEWEKDGENDRDYYADDYARDDRNEEPYYDDYDDRGRDSSKSSSTSAVQSSMSTLQKKFKNGDRRIGLPLLAAGVVFTVMGVSLFFNKSLMRLGNLMFIAGVPASLGPGRTASYFFQPQKTRATACLGAGIFLVFVGWPIFGIALEIFGIMNLFGNMFPVFWAVVKNMPIVSSLTNRNAGSGRKQTYSYDRERSQDYRDDPYEDDRRGYSDYRDDDDAERYF